MRRTATKSRPVAPRTVEREASPLRAGAPAAPTVVVLVQDERLAERIREEVNAVGIRTHRTVASSSLVDEIARHRPCCVVIDAAPDLERARALCQELEWRELGIPTLVVTERTDVASAIAAVRAGVLDVIEMETLTHRLVPCILQAIASDLDARARSIESDVVRLRYARLSPRERDVLKLVIEGATSSTIAARLGLREKTVEVYRSHINKKMCTRNAAELARVITTLS